MFADLHTTHRTAAEDLFDGLRRENSLAAEKLLFSLFSGEGAVRRAGLSLLERLRRTDRKAAARLMVGMILSQPLGDISPPVSLLDIIKSSKYSVISPHFSMLIKSHNSLALHRQFVLEMVTPSSQEPGGQLCMRYDWLFSPPHLFLLPILLRVCFSQTVLDRTCYAQP